MSPIANAIGALKTFLGFCADYVGITEDEGSRPARDGISRSGRGG